MFFLCPTPFHINVLYFFPFVSSFSSKLVGLRLQWALEPPGSLVAAQIIESHPWSFCFHRSGVQSKNLYFSQTLLVIPSRVPGPQVVKTFPQSLWALLAVKFEELLMPGFLRSFQDHGSILIPALVSVCFCDDHAAWGWSVSVYFASSRLPGAQPGPPQERS